MYTVSMLARAIRATKKRILIGVEEKIGALENLVLSYKSRDTYHKRTRRRTSKKLYKDATNNNFVL